MISKFVAINFDLAWFVVGITGSVFEGFYFPIQETIAEIPQFNKMFDKQSKCCCYDSFKEIVTKTRWQPWLTNIKILDIDCWTLKKCLCQRNPLLCFLPQRGLGLCRKTLPSQRWLPGRRWCQHRRYLRPGCPLSTRDSVLRRDQELSSLGGLVQTNAGQDESTLWCRHEASVRVSSPMQRKLLSSYLNWRRENKKR